jgi:hypothetical protein
LKALQKLDTSTFTEADLDDFRRELKQGGDRGVAILAATVTEDLLRHLLLRRMVALKSSEAGDLFGAMAPLSSFAAKIRVAHAFDIIGQKAKADLELMREIRNAFAHVRRAITFETPAIAEACGLFHCGKAYEETTIPRQMFTRATVSLAGYIVLTMNPSLASDIKGAKLLASE